MFDKQQVMAMIQGGRWLDAKMLCSQICQAAQNDAEAWFLMAGIHAQMGELDGVIAACRKVIVLQPENIAGYYNLGVALQSQDQHADAAAAYTALLSRNPGHALALANLGLAQRALGKAEEAISSCRRAIELKPDLVEAHNTLGLLLKDIGKFEEAAATFVKALKFRPGFAEAHFNLGLCHEAQGGLEEATNLYRQAVGYKSNYAEAHARLGNLLVTLGKPEEGIGHYRQALAVRPEWFEIWNALGNALLDAEDFRTNYAEAEKCFRQALILQPDSPEVYLNLGVMFQDAHKYDDAQPCFQQALELKPGYPDALAGMAMLMELKGEFQAGYTLLRPLIESGTDNVKVALAYAELSRHVDLRADAAAVLERCLPQCDADRQRIDVYFTLGKLFDELKEFDKAFNNYHQANSLDVKTFDARKSEREFNELMQMFSAENMARRPRASNRSRLPVFIVGMPRSGTSLVEQILASHPEVYGAGELGDIHSISTELPALANTPLPYPQCMDALKRKTLDQAAQRHLDRLAVFSRSATRVTDKMPHNFLGLGLIDTLFPGARVIHCKRDPIDTCLSIYFMRFNVHHLYARDLAELGAYYQQYLRLMAHWKSTLRIPMLEVQYEDLVENQEKISREMVDFCGLEWNDQCLSFHENKRITKTPSYDQVRRPIYKKSVARWKNYEPLLGPLLNALGVKP